MLNNLENNVLEEYKKYDNINKNSNNPLIKILVSYIKPSYLFKTEILTPIHLGRAVENANSKEGALSEENIKWLHENCIGDDDFEGNISNVNRRVGFLTGTYWAWKNYEKLGNPEYFGFFAHRRLLEPTFLKNIRDYDFIIPEKVNLNGSTVKRHFIDFHGQKLFSIMFEVVSQLYPLEIDNFQLFLNQDFNYFYEIYILKKNLFFDFCEWIFPILFNLLKINSKYYEFSQEEKENLIKNYEKFELKYLCNRENFEVYQKRNIGFIIERLTGYYLFKLIQSNLKYNESGVVFTDVKVLNDIKKQKINELRKRIMKDLHE